MDAPGRPNRRHLWTSAFVLAVVLAIVLLSVRLGSALRTDAGLDQMRWTSVAVPSPPPQHIVTRPSS